jgi:hypothetical protein
VDETDSAAMRVAVRENSVAPTQNARIHLWLRHEKEGQFTSWPRSLPPTSRGRQHCIKGDSSVEINPKAVAEEVTRARLAQLEMICAGTASFADPGSYFSTETAQAVKKSGYIVPRQVYSERARTRINSRVRDLPRLVAASRSLACEHFQIRDQTT